MIFYKKFKYPYWKDLELDSPQRTEYVRQIINEKFYLKQIYNKWYQFILSSLPAEKNKVLEIGSGGGFMKDKFPSLITSDIMSISGINLSCPAECLPFKNQCLSAIVMVNVFHHISNPASFFKEASRCLCHKGRIIMIEPWISSFSKIIYSKIHHEPCNLKPQTWSFQSQGPLSDANIALPWIVFHKDLEIWQSFFPQLRLLNITTEVNLRYLISGGLSFKALLPAWTYGIIQTIEELLPLTLQNSLNLFAGIIIEKLDN